MAPQPTCGAMRGRLSFLVLLALVAGPAAIALRDVEAGAADPCINPEERDPSRIVDVWHACDSTGVKVGVGLANATVIYEPTANGGFNVYVVVEYAHETKEFVLECTQDTRFYPTRQTSYECNVVQDLKRSMY